MASVDSLLLSESLPEDWSVGSFGQIGLVGILPIILRRHLRGFSPLKPIYGKLHFGKPQSSATDLAGAVDDVVSLERQWANAPANADNNWRIGRLKRILFFAKRLVEVAAYSRTVRDSKQLTSLAEEELHNI